MADSLSRKEVRELDRQAIEEFGIPGILLMENAGRNCAEVLVRLNPKRLPVVILCGPGNNGGDGYVIARHLDAQGVRVDLIAAETPGPSGSPTNSFQGLPPDALTNYTAALRSGLEIIPFGAGTLSPSVRTVLEAHLASGCWVVDALFGTGLSRALGPPYDELISMVNASTCPVLAVDIPSGLDCDAGEPLGITVRAAHTVTFVALKRGFLNLASRAWTGKLHIVEIGAPRVLLDRFALR